MKKSIVYYDDNNKVINHTGWADGGVIEHDNYKVFDLDDGNSIGINDDIRHFDDKGKRYTDKYLLEQKLKVLEDTQILDGDYIRDKTDLELCETGLMSKNEYNEKQKARRDKAYTERTNELLIKIDMRKRFDDNCTDEEIEAIENEIIAIRTEIKAEYPYVE